jgi:predicted porin
MKAVQFKLAFPLLTLLIGGMYAGQAQAQSNVTIYGRVDGGVATISHVANPDGTSGSLIASSGNSWGTSMLGFTGSEDMGSGVKAIFKLETGFNTSTGVTNGGGTATFSRRTYVGLSSDDMGTLKLGKDLSISNDVWDIDPAGQQNMGSAALVRGRNWNGANNMIEYNTPTWNGFNVGVQLALGEKVGSTSASRKTGVSLSYIDANMTLRAIYDDARDASGLYSDLYNTSKEFTLGGFYTIDKLKLYAAYETLSAPDEASGPTKLTHTWLGFQYQATPAIVWTAAAFHVSQNNGGGSASLFMTGLTYNLSKRTFLYGSVGTLNNAANTNFAIDGYTNPLVGQNQVSTYFGMGHNF